MFRHYPPILISAFFVLLVFSPCQAVVEIGLSGHPPLSIEDVYQREGTAFIAIDEVLSALELDGDWDSVAHVYRIRTPHGWAIISPGSQFLRIGDNFIPIAHRPRFIDGKLRVSEAFVRQQLSPFLTKPLFFRNHNPTVETKEEDPLDRLFAFLLRKKDTGEDHSRRIVAIDPGHGGQDPGAIGLHGSKEKDLNLAVSERLEKLLKMHQDAPVVMTRNDDYAVDQTRRLEIISQSGADILLSLHSQAFMAPTPQGVMLFVQSGSNWDAAQELIGNDSSLLLAQSLERSLRDKGFTIQVVKEVPVLPLGQGDLPRVLVEMGNIGNGHDLETLQDPARQQDLARALFDGLQQYFSSQRELNQ